jgi:hypothetical protein
LWSMVAGWHADPGRNPEKSKAYVASSGPQKIWGSKS